MGEYNRTDDWIIAAASVVIIYMVIYPIYIRILRKRFTKRIENQMVTSAYKLPIHLAPVEIAYIFSTKVNANQIYATLLDLTNRSVLLMEKKQGQIYVKMGPKVESNFKPFEKILIAHIHAAQSEVRFDYLTTGSSRFKLSTGEKVSGSKQYVFWWLLRHSLRTRKIIESRMNGTYLRMLFVFTVIGGLSATIIPLVIVRMFQLFNSGKIDFDRISQTAESGLLFYLYFFPVIIIIGFLMLRFRGRMLGRSWLLTPNYKRYLNQMDAFREFVRLTHSGKLEFETKELKESSIAHTRPYAIAFGFVKKY